MKIPRQFGSSKTSASKAEPGTVDCAAVEQLLNDIAEGLLPDAAMGPVRGHAANCTACQEKLAQVQRGREWLQVLKQEPLEPPAGMVARILAKTSLAGAPGAAELPTEARPTGARVPADTWQPERQVEYVLPGFGGEATGTMPEELGRDRLQGAKARAGANHAWSTGSAWQHNTVVVLRRTLVEPRLAMVAAMAFFSITLTLNLVGVRLTNLHPADLAPSNMRRAASRQYAEVNARMARYYENLRIVYEVEARVQQLRRAAETNPAQQQERRPRKRSSNSTGDAGAGEAHRSREGLITKHAIRVPAAPDPLPVRTGPRMDASWHSRGQMPESLGSDVEGFWQAFPPLRMTGFPTMGSILNLRSLNRFARRSNSAPERGFA